MALFLILIALIAIAAGLAWYLISHDHGEKEPVGALWIAAALGFLGAIGAIFIEGALISQKNLLPGVPLRVTLVSALTIGVIEEACKFVPLALILYKKRYFNEHTDGVIYFALAGLGFGLPENLAYTLQFGASTGLARVILTPIFHAATTGIVGYFLIRGKLANQTRTLSWFALLGAMIVHGLYDFGLMSGVPLLALVSIMITIALSIGLFLLYGRATRDDQALGLSVVGINTFCRSCGAPNPKHHLYCNRCGQHA